jgi:hypothetical protein
MFCSHCGTNHPDDSQFCRKCGQTLAVVTSTGGAAAAVAPARTKTQVSKAHKVGRSLRTGMYFLPMLLALVLVGAWYFMRITFGSQGTSRAIAAVVHTPVALKDEVENLPAASWKGVGLNLPYTGSVSINLNVVQGNPVDVFLTSTDQLEAMKNEDWKKVTVSTDFSATKTRTYRREARLGQGSYYLVMRDTSLGILSASATDISVKAQLNP